MAQSSAMLSVKCRLGAAAPELEHKGEAGEPRRRAADAEGDPGHDEPLAGPAYMPDDRRLRSAALRIRPGRVEYGLFQADRGAGPFRRTITVEPTCTLS